MSLTTSTTATLKLEGTTISQEGPTRTTASHAVNLVKSYADGTGNNQADFFFSKVVNISSGNSLEFDLTNLTTEVLGGSISYSLQDKVVKAFAVNVLSTGVDTEVTISTTGATGWSNLLGTTAATPILKAESYFTLTNFINGIAVTTGNKDFQLTDTGGVSAEVEFGIVAVTGI